MKDLILALPGTVKITKARRETITKDERVEILKYPETSRVKREREHPLSADGI